MSPLLSRDSNKDNKDNKDSKGQFKGAHNHSLLPVFNHVNYEVHIVLAQVLEAIYSYALFRLFNINSLHYNQIIIFCRKS